MEMGMEMEADLLDLHAGKAIGDGGVLLHFRLLRPEGVVREWVRVHHWRGHHRSSAASTAVSLHAAFGDRGREAEKDELYPGEFFCFFFWGSWGV